jgi:hypothetical protein
MSKKTGKMKHVPLSNKGVRAWETEAIRAFKEQWGGLPKIPPGVPLHAKIVSFQGDKQHLDLSNSYEAPQDALQKAEVISNDYWIESHDGSRKLRDIARPRVVVFLSILEDSNEQSHSAGQSTGLHHGPASR